jgi:spore coat protein H
MSLLPLRPTRVALLAATAVLLACRDDSGLTDPEKSSDPVAVAYNRDWTNASHGNDVAPNYGVVFPQEAVNSLEITMTAAQWTAVRANMRTLFGADFGVAPGGPGGMPGGAPGGAPGGFPATEPDYVDVTMKFNGKTWKNVGFRLKGNSSLSAAWRQGNYKLPFRLQFDEFEDSIPAIKNQRFFGFKEVSMSPAWSDQSLLREKLAADVFRLAGVPAARTAFYRVSVDFGAGAKYCGVYTMVEVIDDTMVEDQFGSDDGNIYKPESRLQAFVPAQFEKKNNETAADFRDVQAFVAALNAPTRTSDAAAWRAGLEATFDVDHFLKRLAVNNAIVNWDTYGAMAHNYYLYSHPTRKLVWIPWDHNMSMTGNPGITAAAPGTPGQPAGGAQGLSLTMNEVSAAWPLLRHLADDPVYFARYKAHMRAFNEGVFTPAAMNALIDRYAALLAPHVTGAADAERAPYGYLPSAAAFTNAVGSLKAHVQARRALVSTFAP